MKGSKRIIANTAILYLKSILTAVIGFVTSRLVLDALGASDYGLYNVVGGIVVMLNTLSTSMTSTSYRYMAIEIGKGDKGDPNRIYNTVLCIHILLAALLLIAGETVGVFYVRNYLNVDPVKIPDALFVLHVSLLTTAFAIITIPTKGLLIAKEKFFFISSVEVVSVMMKLSLILMLMYIRQDKLRWYAVFLAICQLFVPLCYQAYCSIRDRASVKWKFNRNFSDYKEMFAFAWWILIGAVACLGQVQGVAVIMNFFFGTVANAAFGLALQLNGSVSYFSANIQQAALPQIMKSQGGGDMAGSVSYVYAVSRCSFLALAIIAVPVAFAVEPLLAIWLKEPPEYTDIFVLLLIVNALVSNLGAGMTACIQATGKIRTNQVGYSVINLSILPVIFILYGIGAPIYCNVIVMIALTFITTVFQIYLMTKLTVFEVGRYVRCSLVPSLAAVTLCCILTAALRGLIPCDTVISTLTFCAISAIVMAVCACFIGLSSRERKTVAGLLRLRRNRQDA